MKNILKNILDIGLASFILVLFVSAWPITVPLTVAVLVGVAITSQFPTGDE